MHYPGGPLWQKLVKTIADECEIEEVSAETAASAILDLPEIEERDCPDCGGTGYGGHGPHIEFCTCTAGGLAIAFHRSDPKAYLMWLLSREEEAA